MKRVVYFQLALALTLFSFMVKAEESVTPDEKEDIQAVRGNIEQLRAFAPVPALALRDLFFPPVTEVPKKSATESTPRISDPNKTTGADGIKTAIRQPPQLLGIVIKPKSREAYFKEGERSFTVHEGNTLTERYRVQRIEEKKVKLLDVSTGLARVIDWSGNE